jgi:hypothetical protein
MLPHGVWGLKGKGLGQRQHLHLVSRFRLIEKIRVPLGEEGQSSPHFILIVLNHGVQEGNELISLLRILFRRYFPAQPAD